MIFFLSKTFSLLSNEFPRGSGLPLYYWRQARFTNFGDVLSHQLVERIVERPVPIFSKPLYLSRKKLLAIGSILSFAADGDVVWGSGINGKLLNRSSYRFQELDIRAVRGPLSRQFLINELGLSCPEVYGDPALLFPYLFPEMKKPIDPKHSFIIIPHYSESHAFPKLGSNNIVYPTEPWEQVVRKILDSKFVISSSLHGIIIAEAYGIPARLLRITESEPIFKYMDYYSGTGRPFFQYATSVEEALFMGGEKPFACDLGKLYNTFPFEFWND